MDEIKVIQVWTAGALGGLVALALIYLRRFDTGQSAHLWSWAWLLFFSLAFFPPSFAAIGAALVYELTGQLWSTAIGIVYGAGTGVLLVRDFLHWRLRWITAVVGGAFAAVFAVAFW